MSGAPGDVKVFLAGEGSNELGSRFGHPSYQSDDRPGVLYALLLRVQPTGWQVIGARDWKSIRKYRAGKASHADTHNVLGAALDAIEAHGDVLVFSRDLDNDSAREAGVNEGLARIPSISQHLRVIGGVAIPKLEGGSSRSSERRAQRSSRRAAQRQRWLKPRWLARTAWPWQTSWRALSSTRFRPMPARSAHGFRALRRCCRPSWRAGLVSAEGTDSIDATASHSASTRSSPAWKRSTAAPSACSPPP